MRYVSLFSGLEGAHLALAPLGWVCVAVAEVDPSACALLAQRFPGVPNLGDVTKITEADLAALGHVDCVIGGSPCQDLSIAGKGAGLAGLRSGLFFDQVRIFHAARLVCGARWLWWENVPGALGSNAGGDFALVAGTLAGVDLAVPQGGFGSEGLAVGPHGLVEWSVLDAQWFGVAQRRRRLFAVLDSGDWASRPPVLLEPESLRGDSAPRREAGKGPAGTLTARANSGRGPGADEAAHSLIPEVAGTLLAGQKMAGSASLQEAVAGQLLAFGGNNGQGAVEVAPALNAGGTVRMDFATETLLVDQTIAFDCKTSEPGRGIGIGIAPTLRAMNAKDGNQNAGGQLAVCIGGEFAHSLRADGFDASEDGSGRGTPVIAIDVRTRGDDGRGYDRPDSLSDDLSPTLQTFKPPAVAYMADSYAVRRLTPRECERLQGVEDDWTLVMKNGKPMADGPRYKMIGNGFAIPVIAWIGMRITEAHAWK